ncbi:Fic family protein [soil metagenome]
MQKKPGKYIGGQGNYNFYVPNPLPPQIIWDLPLVNNLSNADRLLGYLAGEGGQLPNPHILIMPFLVREAVLSSRIEGTRATIADIFADKAGVESDADRADLKEVNNYIRALEYGKKRIQTLPLSLRLLRELHEKLMTHVRGQNSAPGEFRKSQNWIGPANSTLENATYVPPSPEYLTKCLNELEQFLNENTLPPLIQIALAHYQFEAIHPFLDGNGRVGRLLITLFLIERKILPTPLLYLSAYFEATRTEYYARLLAVTQAGDWSGWLHYFLKGVALQAEDATSRAARINKLLDKWRKKTAGMSTTIPNQLIDRLASNPFITTNQAAESFEVSYTTMQRAIEKLAKLGIIKEISGSKRNRIYCAKEILAILEEPAKIHSS